MTQPQRESQKNTQKENFFNKLNSTFTHASHSVLGMFIIPVASLDFEVPNRLTSHTQRQRTNIANTWTPSCKAHFGILTSLFDKINGFLELGGVHSGGIEVFEKTLTGSSLLSAAVFCSFAFPLLPRLFHSSALTESLAQATLSW